MIRKHVDLVAIGVLLGGIAFYSGARRCMVLTVAPHKRITFVQRLRAPIIAVPEIPRIPYTRD